MIMGFLFFYSLYLHINTAGKAIGSHDGFIIELHSVIMAWLAALFVETNATAAVQCEGSCVCNGQLDLIPFPPKN